MEPPSGIPVRVFWILGAGVLSFSFSPILVRLAGEAPGATVAMWRTLLAGAFLLPFVGRSEIREWKRQNLTGVALMLAAGVLLGFHFIVWIESIYHTSVASATVLFTTNPLFIGLLGFLVLDERLPRPAIFAILIAVIGAALMGLGDATDQHFPRSVYGNGLALASAVLFAGYLLIGRVARQVTSWLAYVFSLYVTVAITAVVYALVRQVPLTGFGWEVYVACALMAVGPQILGHGSLNYAVRYIPAAILGLLGLVEPVLATFWAWMLFDEIPSTVSLTGIAIVLSGLSLLYLPRRNLFSGNSEKRLRRNT
jgi:drug/metabolite transporter (DMT)-like permease